MFSRFFFPCSRCRRCWKCCCGGGLGRNRRGRGFCKGETETTHNGPRKTLKVGNSCTCTAPTPILATQRKGKLRWRSARCRELRMSLLMAPQLMDMRRPRATRREKRGNARTNHGETQSANRFSNNAVGVETISNALNRPNASNNGRDNSSGEDTTAETWFCGNWLEHKPKNEHDKCYDHFTCTKWLQRFPTQTFPFAHSLFNLQKLKTTPRKWG